MVLTLFLTLLAANQVEETTSAEFITVAGAARGDVVRRVASPDHLLGDALGPDTVDVVNAMLR